MVEAWAKLKDSSGVSEKNRLIVAEVSSGHAPALPERALPFPFRVHRVQHSWPFPSSAPGLPTPHDVPAALICIARLLPRFATIPSPRSRKNRSRPQKTGPTSN